MIALTVAQIADIVGGKLADIDPAEAASTPVTGPVEFDSRAIVPGKVIEATAEELRAGLGRDKRAQVRAVDAEQERAQRDGPCAYEYCERGEQRRVVDLVVAGVQARVGDG